MVDVSHPVDTLILDLPFCSVRAHRYHDWTNLQIQCLKDTVSFQHLALNLDGIYSDHELAIIRSSIINRKLNQIFTACRIQDPGLILWLQEFWPDAIIHLNPETGIQNIPAIQALLSQGIDRLVLNHETPHGVIQSIRNQFPNLELEIMVQGPLLIQYSKRKFLSDYYETSEEAPIRLTAQDKDFKHRIFTFLNTAFGHFMFAQFHRSLAAHGQKLIQLNCHWLIDGRGESTQYKTTSLDLYVDLENHTSNHIDDALNILSRESGKPQKPGFFLSNNTDYDWRNEIKTNRCPVGRVISKKSGDFAMIEFFEPLTVSSKIDCMNPDHTNTEIDLSTLRDINHGQLNHTIHPFTPYLLPPDKKRVQFKGLLYLKNS